MRLIFTLETNPMKKVNSYLIILIPVFFFSCSNSVIIDNFAEEDNQTPEDKQETEDNQEAEQDDYRCDTCNYCDASELYQECYGELCTSDTCENYFTIWKELFISNNQMTEDYFDNHIFPCMTILHKWNSGISFRISYQIIIDWVEAWVQDDFIILIDSAENHFPHLDLPRDTLLSKDQIEMAVSGGAFSSRMHKVEPIDHLKFPTLQNALDTLISTAGVDTLCSRSIYYESHSKNSPSNGHPYLEANAFLNLKENQCIYTDIDLVTGEIKIRHDLCMII